MLSKEDQRRFEQITRHLRESDPEFFARLDHRARSRVRRSRLLILLTIVLWAALPVTAAIGGRPAGVACGLALLVNSGLMWHFRRRWL